MMRRSPKRAGMAVQLVMGSEDNLKITTDRRSAARRTALVRPTGDIRIG